LPLRNLVMRRRARPDLPGLYVYEGIDADAAWVVLQTLEGRIGVFPSYPSYDSQEPTKDLFTLPLELFPEWGLFRSCERLSSSWGRSRWRSYGFAVPSVEVVADELTPDSRQYIVAAIARDPGPIAGGLDCLTLAEWADVLGQKPRRRADIRDCVAANAAAVLDRGDKMVGTIDRGACEILEMESADILLPRKSLKPGPSLGERQASFTWHWNENDREGGLAARQEAFVLSQTDKAAFRGRWARGHDVGKCDMQVQDGYPVRAVPAYTSFPMRVEALVAQLGVDSPAQSWVDTLREGLEHAADSEAAAQAYYGPDHTVILQMTTSNRQDQPCSTHRFWSSGPDHWYCALDFASLAYYLEPLEAVEMPSDGRRGEAVCRIVPDRRGTLLDALARPDADAGHFLNVWLLDGLRLSLDVEDAPCS
jgi:hypothetical protein